LPRAIGSPQRIKLVRIGGLHKGGPPIGPKGGGVVSRPGLSRWAKNKKTGGVVDRDGPPKKS